MKKIALAILFSALYSLPVMAQQIPRFNPDTLLTVTIDSAINITAKRLSAETFIDEILRDTSFYEAFRNMKKYTFTAENQLYTYNKHNKVEAKLYRKLLHTVSPGADRVKVLAQRDSGKIYKKNGKYQLYTVEMFDYIFMNAYKSAYSASAESPVGGGTNQSYKQKLKTLLFSPGRPVKGIPFISDKTEIFTANMRQYYDYNFYSGTYLDSIPVYRFKVTQKTDLSNWTKSGIMIKELTTIFDKRNMQILGRYVDMKYSNMLFDFDVQMNIELGYFIDGETLLPVKISYQGNWNVPLKKEERVSFLIQQGGYR
ncbi:hypothetical protein FW774_03575 (plasmid) [Pedobacter sp. BS3]|uniref:hypothetical protein n=1 Tax=Pedobacter sp. BS3 TaxID=2567937 RepID=UPI0011EFCA11|nr:hypothetical protein [Pedobacter sp. BS3]TZF86142.1 hypothetical protein FW774_03575 [Pedobacter sp. BS3]